MFLSSPRGSLASSLDIICAPLVEGAFIGLLVASQLGLQFAYSERFARLPEEELFPAGYRLPAALRPKVRGKRVAIVNDVINAGSSMRGTFEDLSDCGATIVAIGSLLVLGTAAWEFAESKQVALESIAYLPNNLWKAADCPLCNSAVPLEDVEGFRSALRGSHHKRA